MLLRSRTRLLRRLGARRGDEGSALVTVIGIAAVVAIVSVALVASVTFGASQSARTRAGIQAQASAEALIDSTIAQMSTFTYGTETSFPCTLTDTRATGSGSATSTARVQYRVKGGTTFQCPVPSALEVVEAQITATSTVTLASGSGQRSSSRTVKQRLAVQDRTTTSSLLPYAFFSGESLTVTNRFTLNGGGLHTNGNYSCNSSGTIAGPVTAVGSVYLTNTCKTQQVAAGGTFKCDSGPTVSGDVTAAGTGQSTMDNTCRVAGSVTVGGSMKLGGTGISVGKNVVAATGSIVADPTGARIVQGYGRAAGTITAGDVSAGDAALQKSRLNQVFGSGYTPKAPSAVPAAPTRVEMPTMTWQQLTPPGTTTMTMGAWVRENALRNGSTAGTPLSGTDCRLAGPSWGINGPATNPDGGATVIDARSCAVNLQDLTLNLSGDLTLVVKSLETNNSLTVNSTKAGGNARLRIVVPSTAGAATCSAAETNKGSVTLRNTVAIGSNVDVLVYTNGVFEATNVVTMRGSVYACSMNLSVDVTITYADMTPVGMNPPTTGTYAFQPTARYNL